MYPVRRWEKLCITHLSVWDHWHALFVPALSSVTIFVRPCWKDPAWAHSLCLMISFACVCCGSEPQVFSMGRHNPSPLHPLAGRRKLVIHAYTQTLQEITLDFVSCFFQGQKPGLTDVQAELDRMTRKQDSMVSTNNVPPPTENEAWRRQKQLHHPLHKHSGRIHVHHKIDQIPKVYQSAHTVAPPKWVSDAIRHFGFLVRWKEDKWKC